MEFTYCISRLKYLLLFVKQGRDITHSSLATTYCSVRKSQVVSLSFGRAFGQKTNAPSSSSSLPLSLARSYHCFMSQFSWLDSVCIVIINYFVLLSSLLLSAQQLFSSVFIYSVFLSIIFFIPSPFPNSVWMTTTPNHQIWKLILSLSLFLSFSVSLFPFWTLKTAPALSFSSSVGIHEFETSQALKKKRILKSRIWFPRLFEQFMWHEPFLSIISRTIIFCMSWW